ncbi:hypothetical protein J437_LFUL011527, partial [Ladona fulva]
MGLLEPKKQSFGNLASILKKEIQWLKPNRNPTPSSKIYGKQKQLWNLNRVSAPNEAFNFKIYVRTTGFFSSARFIQLDLQGSKQKSEPSHPKGIEIDAEARIKKGEEGSGRCIVLLNVAYKIFTSIPLHQVSVYAEDILEDYRCGFRYGRSTIDYTFTIRQMAEKYYKYNIDFHQAFHCLNRKEMLLSTKSIQHVLITRSVKDLKGMFNNIEDIGERMVLNSKRELQNLMTRNYENARKFTYLKIVLNNENKISDKIIKRISFHERPSMIEFNTFICLGT